MIAPLAGVVVAPRAFLGWPAGIAKGGVPGDGQRIIARSGPSGPGQRPAALGSPDPAGAAVPTLTRLLPLLKPRKGSMTPLEPSSRTRTTAWVMATAQLRSPDCGRRIGGTPWPTRTGASNCSQAATPQGTGAALLVHDNLGTHAGREGDRHRRAEQRQSAPRNGCLASPDW